MKNKSAKTEILEKIEFLKIQQSAELLDLKNHYHQTAVSLKPLNLIKSLGKEIVLLPNLKSNLIKTAIGSGTNFLTEKFLSENSANPVKRVLGKILKIAMKNFIGSKSMKI